MTCPYVFKDFTNVIDGRLLSSTVVSDDTAVELSSKSDYNVSLLVSLLVVGGSTIICRSTINSSADSWAEARTYARAEEASSGGRSGVSDLLTGGGRAIISSAAGVSDLDVEHRDLFGDLLDKKQIAVIDLVTTEIFCVLVALVPVMLWLADVSST